MEGYYRTPLSEVHATGEVHIQQQKQHEEKTKRQKEFVS